MGTNSTIFERGRAAVGLFCCALSVVLAGCQQQPTTVKGTVTLDGQPLAITKGMRGTVVFQPRGAEGTTLNGMINSSGNYELSTGASLAVNPGAYWVAVSAVEIIPASAEHPEPRGRRITPANYASATDSGFRVELGPGENVVDLDMRSDAKSPEKIDAATPETPDDAPTHGEATPSS
jgi:hypothetical protein